MIFKRNRVQVSRMVGLSFIFAALIVVVLSAPALAQAKSPPQFDTSDECPNPANIREFSGNDSVKVDTPEFTVAGDALRVRYSKLPNETSGTSLTVQVFSQSGDSKDQKTFNSSKKQGFEDFTELESGEYSLQITPATGITSYVIAVDNCVSGDGNSDSGSAGDQYSGDIEITNIINIPDKALPDTGGPPLLAIFFSAVAGVGLLTAVVRRRH